jgi:5-methylcytosine-specific restriction endonuclease McrA
MVRVAGVKAKLRAHLLDNLGSVVAADELRSLAGTSEWARHVRELRDKEGFDILTHNDRSDLKPGEYVLASLKPRPAFAPNISKEAWAFVLEHIEFTCQSCGAVAGEPHPFDPTKKMRLHIDYFVDKSEGGSDDPENLRAFCSACNEGRANLSLPRPPSDRLLMQLRRASGVDQIKVLEWLVRKYPRRTERFLSAQHAEEKA